MEPVARHRARPVRGGALLAGDVDEASVLFAEASSVGDRAGQHRHDRLRRGRARVHWPWTRVGGRLPSQRRTGPRHHRRAWHARLPRQRARLRRGRASRGAQRRHGASATDSSPGRCGPAQRARMPCPPSPSAVACSSQRCTGSGATSPPHGTCCGRSTTSCCTGRPWGPWSTRCRSSVTSSAPPHTWQQPAPHRSPLRSCGCCPTCRPTSRSREIGQRLFVSRNTVSSEVASIYRKLGVSSRSDAVERATEVGFLGG